MSYTSRPKKLLLATATASATSYSLLRTFASAGIRASALAMNRQVAAMAHATIATNFDQALDIQLLFTAEVAFYLEVLGNVFAQRSNFGLSQILDTSIRINFGLSQNCLRASQAYPKEIGQANFDTLIAREVNTFNTSHVLLTLSLFVLRVFADHEESAIALNDFTFRAAFADRG
jgi:hypothetical protein